MAAAANSMGERMARLEAEQKNAADNATRDRQDIRERIDELHVLLIKQGDAHAAATKQAAEAAARANETIAEFTNKLSGAKLLGAGLMLIAGAAGGIVVKLATLVMSPTQHP